MTPLGVRFAWVQRFMRGSLLTTTVSGACIVFVFSLTIWRFFSACMHDEVALGFFSSSSSSVMIDTWRAGKCC
jgi:Na+/H+-dicarboxylate symporter